MTKVWSKGVCVLMTDMWLYCLCPKDKDKSYSVDPNDKDMSY